MPTYVYRCKKGHTFELFHSIADDTSKRCPQCRSVAQRVPAGGAGLLFKGSGFYVTDYRSKPYQESAKKESAEKGDKAPSPASGGSADGGTSSGAPAGSGDKTSGTASGGRTGSADGGADRGAAPSASDQTARSSSRRAPRDVAKRPRRKSGE
jgi:putative FmdB family regulatory protein